MGRSKQNRRNGKKPPAGRDSTAPRFELPPAAAAASPPEVDGAFTTFVYPPAPPVSLDPPPLMTPEELTSGIESYNGSEAKATEQFDKTVTAVATVGLGFSFSVFTGKETVPPILEWLAAGIMAAFGLAVLSSLVSFQFTIFSVRRGRRLLIRRYQGEDVMPNSENDPLDVATDVCNLTALACIGLGVAGLVTFGYLDIMGAKTVANEDGLVPIRTDYMVNDPPGHANAGVRRPTIALPTAIRRPVEAPKPQVPPSAGSDRQTGSNEGR